MSNSETTVPIDNFTIGSLKVYEDEKIASLKEFFLALRTDDQRAIKAALVAQEKAVAAALAAAKEAVSKAEAASEKRFESVNEFRQTLSDQTASFLPRPEYDANHKALEDKIDAKYEALLANIQALTARMNVNSGRSTQKDVTLGKIVAIVGVSVSVLGLFITIIVLAANGIF